MHFAMFKPMNPNRITRSLLFYESFAFALLITISWLDELIGLPAMLFGGAVQPNWHEAALETVVISGVAIPTLLLTRRLVRRLVYLEGLLHVCGWCRKINVNNQWMPMEQYFATELKTMTSHGICQECSARQLAQIG